MTIFEAVALAVIQGLTEFLPISSSGHLALAPWLFGWKDQGLTFDIALHFGTLLAVLIYFFRDWLQLAAQGFGLPYRPDPVMARRPQMLWWMAAASVPVGVVGLFLKDYAETALRNPWSIGGMFISVGLLMWWADEGFARRKQIDGITFLDAMTIGAAQALAVVPGTSRSGITIVAGRFRELERPAAARFSFLLSTPAIAAAAAKAFLDLRKQGGISDEMMAPFLAGMAVSGLTGLVVIAFFLRYLENHGLRLFVYYRVIFGIIVIALAFIRGPLAGTG
ncbi:MAG: undecaprenyl-diphosphate phosphatase [Acidobacteria bacterium]|nr:undecaprenyl-diphosphate phosphatase [Acidobacteriota bacterium]